MTQCADFTTDMRECVIAGVYITLGAIGMVTELISMFVLRSHALRKEAIMFEEVNELFVMQCSALLMKRTQVSTCDGNA